MNPVTSSSSSSRSDPDVLRGWFKSGLQCEYPFQPVVNEVGFFFRPYADPQVAVIRREYGKIKIFDIELNFRQRLAAVVFRKHLLPEVPEPGIVCGREQVAVFREVEETPDPPHGDPSVISLIKLANRGTLTTHGAEQRETASIPETLGRSG